MWDQEGPQRGAYDTADTTHDQETTMGKAYDKATDVLDHCTLGIGAQSGRFGARDHVLLYRNGSHADLQVAMPEGVRWRMGQFDKAGADRTKAQEWLYQLMVRKMADTPATGWARCPRTDIWCALTAEQAKVTKRKLIPTPHLCCQLMSRDEGRWTSYTVCTRQAVAGEQCTFHQAVDARATARSEATRAEWAARDEQRARERQATADLRELWARVCEQRDVMVPGTPMVSGPDAHVDSEVLFMLLRELDMDR